MSLPKTWTECHEEVYRGGMAQPCDARPVVALRGDETTGETIDDPRSWYPVCARHTRAPMAELWRVLAWAAGPERTDAGADHG